MPPPPSYPDAVEAHGDAAMLNDLVLLGSLVDSIGGMVGELAWSAPDPQTGITAVRITARSTDAAQRLKDRLDGADIALSSKLVGSPIRADLMLVDMVKVGHMEMQAAEDAFRVEARGPRSQLPYESPRETVDTVVKDTKLGHVSIYHRRPRLLHAGGSRDDPISMVGFATSSKGRFNRWSRQLHQACAGIDLVQAVVQEDPTRKPDDVRAQLIAPIFYGDIIGIAKRYHCTVIMAHRQRADDDEDQAADAGRRTAAAVRVVGLRDQRVAMVRELAQVLKSKAVPHMERLSEQDLSEAEQQTMRELCQMRPHQLVQRIESED